MKPPNPQEKAVLDHIRRCLDKEGFAPSVRDLKEALGYKSTSTVQMYLDRLEANGYLRRAEGKSRSLRPVDRTVVRMLPVFSYDGIECEAPLAYALSEDAPEHIALRIAEGKAGEMPRYLILREGYEDSPRPIVVRKNGQLCFVEKHAFSPSEGLPVWMVVAELKIY